MKPRDCVRLLIVGVCTGLLPACMGAPRPDQFAGSGSTVGERAPLATVLQRPNWSQATAGMMPNRATTSVALKPMGIETTPLAEKYAYLAPAVAQARLPAMPTDSDIGPVLVRGHMPTDDATAIVRANSDTRPQLLASSIAVEPGLVAALRCFLDKRPDAALPCLNHYDSENQEVLLSLLPLTARMSEGPLSQADPREVAVILDQLEGLKLVLQPKAALVMDKACFCRQVRKFGVYEALGEKPAFRPGELVEVYCEIRNVTSERSKVQPGECRTHLQSSLEIRNSSIGFKLQSRNTKAEVSHTPQHDFYLHYSFAIKDDMRPGPYVMTLEVVDVPTGRKVGRKLEFVVRAE
jgi:hypothetical protein